MWLQIWTDISSTFSRNSEAETSEFLENVEQIWIKTLCYPYLQSQIAWYFSTITFSCYNFSYTYCPNPFHHILVRESLQYLNIKTQASRIKNVRIERQADICLHSSIISVSTLKKKPSKKGIINPLSRFVGSSTYLFMSASIKIQSSWTDEK